MYIEHHASTYTMVLRALGCRFAYCHKQRQHAYVCMCASESACDVPLSLHGSGRMDGELGNRYKHSCFVRLTVPNARGTTPASATKASTMASSGDSTPQRPACPHPPVDWRTQEPPPPPPVGWEGDYMNPVHTYFDSWGYPDNWRLEFHTDGDWIIIIEPPPPPPAGPSLHVMFTYIYIYIHIYICV